MTARNNNLIWIDLEMTGLDPDNDYIIEIATAVTDPHLNLLAEGPTFAIYQPDAILDKMDDWNSRQHRGSGLYDRVRQSVITAKMAEEKTIEFLQEYVNSGKSPMCGNSICQDRRFLHRYMPDLEKFFHYRHVDVSTVKELARRWIPEVLKGIKKESKHLAMDDIRDSIEELKHYKKNFFKGVEL